MKKFPYIEDYLFYLAGYENIGSRGHSPSRFMPHHFSATWIPSFRRQSPIQLASYDVNILTSLTAQLYDGTALTDRQGELASKMVTKYRKQMAKNGVDAPGEPHAFFMPLRKVNRSKTLVVTDDGKSMEARFPFEPRIVDALKKLSKDGRGIAVWNQDAKNWTIDINDHTVNTVVTIAKQAGFEIDRGLLDAYDEIERVGATPYRILLRMDETGRPTIDNAPPALLEWVEQHLGFDDVVRLADYGSVLGYEIDDPIKEAVAGECGPEVADFMTSPEYRLEAQDRVKGLEEALKILMRVRRLPAILYSPTSKLLDVAQRVLGADRVRYIDTDETIVMPDPKTIDDPTTPLLYYCGGSLPEFEGTIPAVISTMNLTFGKTRAALAQEAHRIIYLCTALPR